MTKKSKRSCKISNKELAQTMAAIIIFNFLDDQPNIFDRIVRYYVDNPESFTKDIRYAEKIIFELSYWLPKLESKYPYKDENVYGAIFEFAGLHKDEDVISKVREMSEKDINEVDNIIRSAMSDKVNWGLKTGCCDSLMLNGDSFTPKMMQFTLCGNCTPYFIHIKMVRVSDGAVVYEGKNTLAAIHIMLFFDGEWEVQTKTVNLIEMPETIGLTGACSDRVYEVKSFSQTELDTKKQ